MRGTQRDRERERERNMEKERRRAGSREIEKMEILRQGRE